MATLTTAYQLLAESAYHTYNSTYNGRVCLRLYARISAQSVSSNTSTVYVKLTKYLSAAYDNVYYSCTQKSAGLSGDLSYSWSDGDYTTYYPQTEYTLFEKSFTVWHANDGTSSLSLAASYDDSFVAALSISTVTCALPTIARKSEISAVGFGNHAIEQGFSVAFSPASSAFTHQVQLMAGGSTVVTREDYRSGVTVMLTAAELLALYRMKTKTVTVRLITKSGGNEIGRAELTATLSALGNAHIRAGGAWKRGMLCVGASPGVVMIRHNGAWRLAK